MAPFQVSDDMLAVLVPSIAYWIFAGIYDLLYRLLPDSRLHTKEEEDEKNITAPRSTVIKGVLLQQLIQNAIVFLFVQATGSIDGGTPKPQPSLPVLAWQILVAMVFTDTWQYFGHRYMHANKFLYRHVHSVHHSVVVPYSFGGLYVHPFDAVIDTVGGLLAVILSGMSTRTSIYFFTFAVVKTVDTHCGMWLPWNPFQMLFSNNSAFHDVHHQLKGFHHNYSQPFFLSWDKICGTYMDFSLEKRKGGGYEVRPIKN